MRSFITWKKKSKQAYTIFNLCPTEVCKQTVIELGQVIHRWHDLTVLGWRVTSLDLSQRWQHNRPRKCYFHGFADLFCEWKNVSVARRSCLVSEGSHFAPLSSLWLTQEVKELDRQVWSSSDGAGRIVVPLQPAHHRRTLRSNYTLTRVTQISATWQLWREMS